MISFKHIKQKATNKQKNKIIDTYNRMVVTRGEERYEEDEVSIGGQIQGDWRSLDFDSNHIIKFTEVIL